MTYIGKNDWKDYFKGWLIIDCVVARKDVVFLCLRKQITSKKASLMADADIATRIIGLFPNYANETVELGRSEVSGFNKPRLGLTFQPKGAAMVVARNQDGQVIIYFSRDKLESIDKGNWPNIQRIKSINGYAYAVGQGRKIYKRADIAKWVRIDGFPETTSSSAVGFNDIAAFDENDMYAVGGHGDVWHYNGNAWLQIDFPSDEQINTVVCAPDGNVYIGGEAGNIWCGRNNTWKQVYKGNSSLLWNNLAWYNDQLWLSSDYDFCIWDGEKMTTVKHPDLPENTTGHMDARDGILVICDQDHVYIFDGNNWKTIVAPHK